MERISFAGIKNRYTDSLGRKIIPIAKDPDENEIKEAKNATNSTDEIMEGYNGRCFWLGKNLIVKKYKGEKAFCNNPYAEINMLDKLYDMNLFFNNSQKGIFAIQDNTGVYMVSSKVDGKNPAPQKASFNKENLSSLLNIIFQMDTGAKDKSYRKNHAFSNRIRFMNYDFNGGNINLTDKKAGVFDFEYSVLENIDEMIDKTIIRKKTGANCHQSDTSGLPSSLRSFEFYTFCKYLNKTNNTAKLFDDYIELKGNYHKKMAKFYSKFEKETNFPNIVRDISLKEQVHGQLLKRDKNGQIPADIKLAEAKKIQMSFFMHEQSQFCDTGKINPEQLKQYSFEANDYFMQNYSKACKQNDLHRKIYYKDCLELFSSWLNVNKTLKEKLDNNDFNTVKKLTKETLPILDDKI